jgi:hypothetical protein
LFASRFLRVSSFQPALRWRGGLGVEDSTAEAAAFAAAVLAVGDCHMVAAADLAAADLVAEHRAWEEVDSAVVVRLCTGLRQPRGRADLSLAPAAAAQSMAPSGRAAAIGPVEAWSAPAALPLDLTAFQSSAQAGQVRFRVLAKEVLASATSGIRRAAAR